MSAFRHKFGAFVNFFSSVGHDYSVFFCQAKVASLVGVAVRFLFFGDFPVELVYLCLIYFFSLKYTHFQFFLIGLVIANTNDVSSQLSDPSSGKLKRDKERDLFNSYTTQTNYPSTDN